MYYWHAVCNHFKIYYVGFWLILPKTKRFTGPLNAHLIYEPSSIDGIFVTESPDLHFDRDGSSLQPIQAFVWLVDTTINPFDLTQLFILRDVSVLGVMGHKPS